MSEQAPINAHPSFPIVGKIRKRFLENSVSPPAVDILRAIKKKVDPKNIFGCDNLIPPLKSNL